MNKLEKKGGWHPVGRTNPAWKDNPIKNFNWAYESYVLQKLSMREVAKKAECSLRTVARLLKFHGIESRSHKESLRPHRRRGNKNPNWKGGRACKSCGNDKSYNAKTCAPCYRKTLGGSNHPTWKGLADIKSLLRSHLADAWSPKILKRDKYSCQCCGDATGGNLCAHHIKRLAVIVDDFCHGLVLETAKERFAVYLQLAELSTITDLTNGITLCVSCHKKIHARPFQDEVPLSILNNE